MINKVILQGRLTKDAEIKSTANQNAVATFTIASERSFKNSEGKYDADFINCVAWKNTATFIAQHFSKGDQIVIVGRLQTRSYDDSQGQKRFVTEVIVDEASFCVGKKADRAEAYSFGEDVSDIPFEV